MPTSTRARAGFQERIEELRGQMAAAARRSGRAESSVRLIAVTKTVGIESIRQAMDLGVKDFGENYVQEAVPKISALAGVAPSPSWHLIGHLQTNKVKSAMTPFAWIHSVDRMSLLDELARAGRRGGPMPLLLLQVNIEEDRSQSTKFGFDPSSLPEALARAGEAKLPVRGLMTFPPYFEDSEKARPYYARLRALRDEMSREAQAESIQLHELSMGMSNDFETAIEEGATMVRVGTRLFGPRERA